MCVCLERQTISLIFKLWFFHLQIVLSELLIIEPDLWPHFITNVIFSLIIFAIYNQYYFAILELYDLHNFLFIVDLYGHFKIFNEHFQCLKGNVAFMLYVQIYPLYLCFVLWGSTFCWMRTQIMETNSLYLNPSSVPLWWKKHWTHSSCPNFPWCKMVNY